MLQPRIIPVLLLHDRGLVKTREFGDMKYVGDPINAVKIFNEKEVDELALFDIDASVEGRGPDYEQLRKIAVESRMPLCYGGGITSAEQAAEIIALGFEKASVSASAVTRPELIREMADRVGSQSVIVTVDVRKEGLFGGYNIYTHNGRRKHKMRLLDFIAQAEALGAGEIVINSIDRDGMMQGYDLGLAKSVRNAVNIPLSFVGGAGSTQHMADLISAVGTVGAAAGSMFVFKGTYRAVLISYARPPLPSR
jgi:cyclase